MSYRTTALSKLDVDDNYMMYELESTILHIFRSMQTSYPNDNDGVNPGAVDDEFIDSIEAHQAIMIDKKSGNTLFIDAIRSEVLDNLIKNTGTLKPISQEQLQKLEDYITIPTTVKCKRKLKPMRLPQSEDCYTRRPPCAQAYKACPGWAYRTLSAQRFEP
jgi:hypothetical protein